MLELCAEVYDGQEGRRLVAELATEVAVRYADDGDEEAEADEADALDVGPSDVAPPTGAFLVARLDGVAVGCGALRRGDDGQGEIKRMYVVPAARGRGVARALLAALERAAVDLGYQRVRLVTGLRQPEAMAMYEEAGWVPSPPFGIYVDSPLTRCYAKSLGGRLP